MSDYSIEEIEELVEYGNTFSLIVPIANNVYKIVGWFMKRKLYYDYEYDRELERWLQRNERGLRRILRLYSYQRSDAYRGVYVLTSDKVGRWHLVVKGWVAMLSGDPTIKEVLGLREADVEEVRDNAIYIST